MDRGSRRASRHQRGMGGLVNFVLLAIVVGLGYAAMGYVPHYMRGRKVRHEMLEIGNKALVMSRKDDDEFVEDLIARIEKVTGLEIYEDNVELTRDREAVEIYLFYENPLSFPFQDEVEWVEVEAEVFVERSHAY